LTLRAFKNSLWLSSLSALIIVLFASAISWVTVKSKLPGRGALETLCFLPVAVPGIVFGLSLVWLYLVLPIPIYGTVWILLVAYVTKHMPHGMRFLAPAMNQIHKELEEASIMSGGSWLQTFRRIFLPLLFPTIIACWVYNFITLAREMSASILLYSQDSEVLSVVIFELWEDGNYTEVCALGILMIVTTTAVVLLARLLGSEVGLRRSTAT
jgi:iron(III) transport system permease protein